MKVRIVRVEKDLPLPEYKTEGAVAFDLYTREARTLAPGEMALLPSNLIIEVPEGHVLITASRSSSSKKGLHMPNSIGVIDQDYHGPKDEIGILVRNFSDSPTTVERGERLAQAMIIPIAKAEWDEVEVIKEESRGGFGSTGKF